MILALTGCKASLSYKARLWERGTETVFHLRMREEALFAETCLIILALGRQKLGDHHLRPAWAIIKRHWLRKPNKAISSSHR